VSGSGKHATVTMGRPRDPAIDDAILEATRSLLIEVGYPRLGFEIIAQRAGVTRPTIYRRWPSKMHLVHEAVFPAPRPGLVPDTGHIETDLRQLIQRMFVSYSRPEARAALPGLLADLHDDASLRHSVIDRLEDQARAQFNEVVSRAQRRGQVVTDLDADLVLDTIVGALFHRVVARQQLSKKFADHLGDLVLDGVRPR
jgi:AcrR family transcriptional regulator